MISDPEIKDVERVPTLAIRILTSEDKIAETYGRLFGLVGAYIPQSGATMAGAPYGVYLSFTPEELELEAGAPVSHDVPGEGDIVSSELPGGRVATAIHSGPYETLQEGHQALRFWVETQGLQACGPPCEIFLSDPGLEPDSSKWLTELRLPVV